MNLNPEYAVPHQVYFDAKHYVENKRILFFDFFRNSVFGFVRTSDRGGHFAHVLINEKNALDCHCKCNEADADEVCGHGFALYLKLLNWPFEKVNLSEGFDKDELVTFIKTVGRSLYSKPINLNTNPALSVPEGNFDARLLHYWGFHKADEPSKLTRRDRQCLEKAQRLTRTKQEQALHKKGFPPARVLFEESRLYAVCKLLYALKQISGLTVALEKAGEHEVRLVVRFEQQTVFNWKMPVSHWLKGVGQQWSFWEPISEVRVHNRSLPVHFRIDFDEKNNLEIEPQVEVAPDCFFPVAEVKVSGSPNLYHHKLTGYFRIQTGLSIFEMNYSDPRIHKVNHQDVKKFLKEHGEVLKTLDRRKIDDALFGEMVVEHFHSFTITLEDYRDDLFSYRMQAKLSGNTFGHQEMSELFEGRGRYRKMAGKLFDSGGYDGVYLKPLYDQGAQANLSVPQLSVPQLFRLMSFFRDRLQVVTTSLTEEVFGALKNHSMPDLPDLDHTKLKLRPYQTLGFQWLYFLKHYGLGGLLCDQMGLGKTHQGMALLAAILAENPEAKILVVAPASVIYHWRDKLKTFCPDVSAVTHHGSDRDLATALKHKNVIISTYNTLRNDAPMLEDVVFDLVIYDEIQNLKNNKTKAYKSLKQLRSLCTIGLTGTPIENALEELKALMDLVFPGFLGSDAHFKRYFVEPIVKLDSTAVRTQLQEMVNPFMLRRKKVEVLAELPEKIEDLRKLVRTEYERELYDEIKAAGKKKIKGLSDGHGYLHIFQVINQLKQLCNHPALYFNNDDYHAYPCRKWDIFTELAEEVLAGGEKLVVFTQYLGMIAIFEKYFKKKGVAFATITGQTRNRDKVQERFQTDPNCRVFLGTIRAAGVGIDLTAASTLIHYDRWWNAAREEQATDRIHRIGQKNAVQIYKFLTLGTVEDRIHQIIARKQALLDDLVGFDDDKVAKIFSVDELLEILQ